MNKLLPLVATKFEDLIRQQGLKTTRFDELLGIAADFLCQFRDSFSDLRSRVTLVTIRRVGNKVLDPQTAVIGAPICQMDGSCPGLPTP